MSASPPTGSVEINVLNRLVETIQDVQNGLEPDVIARWYSVIENDAKSLCPTDELRDSIQAIQNPELPMKFEFKSSKRAIKYIIEAIEKNLNSMPFATRLYFEKFVEIMNKELHTYLQKS